MYQKALLKKATVLLKPKMPKLVTKREVCNLKRIRSKLHRSSTYSFGRGFSRSPHPLSNIPVTIFTAQDCKHISNKVGAKVASSILQEVVWIVLEGVLERVR